MRLFSSFPSPLLPAPFFLFLSVCSPTEHHTSCYARLFHAPHSAWGLDVFAQVSLCFPQYFFFFPPLPPFPKFFSHPSIPRHPLLPLPHLPLLQPRAGRADLRLFSFPLLVLCPFTSTTISLLPSSFPLYFPCPDLQCVSFSLCTCVQLALAIFLSSSPPSIFVLLSHFSFLHGTSQSFVSFSTTCFLLTLGGEFPSHFSQGAKPKNALLLGCSPLFFSFPSPYRLILIPSVCDPRRFLFRCDNVSIKTQRIIILTLNFIVFWVLFSD